MLCNRSLGQQVGLAEGVEPLQESHDQIVLAADHQAQEGHLSREELSRKHLYVLLSVQQLAEISSGAYLGPKLAHVQQHCRIECPRSVPEGTVLFSLQALSQGLLVDSHQSHALL